jgi:hypothetical protein
MRVDIFGPSAFAVEGHEEQARHVEGSDAGADESRRPEHPGAPPFAFEGGFDDLVLAPEPGQAREPDDGQPADPEGDPGDLHDGGDAPEPPHVDLVVHAVHHRAGARNMFALKKPWVSRWKIANA